MEEVVPGFMPGVTELHRAVENDPPIPADFRSPGELRVAQGRRIKPHEEADRSFMEGISAHAELARMRWLNENVLKPPKPHIAVLTVERLQSLEAEHHLDGHHDLYGDRQTMAHAVLHCGPAKDIE